MTDHPPTDNTLYNAVKDQLPVDGERVENFVKHAALIAAFAGWKYWNGPMDADKIRSAVYSLCSASARSESQEHFSASTGRICLNVHRYGANNNKEYIVQLTLKPS